MTTLLLCLYFGALAILALLGLHRLFLARAAARAKPPDRPPLPDELPGVLVQLPVYNEAFVVERLIRAAAAIDWPKDRLRIQVLDDSTDHTSALIQRVCHDLRETMGAPIEVVRRKDRTGFKAGALAHGLELSPEYPFVAIFDADFLPPPIFLKDTLPYFADTTVGLVQARWAHENREASLLTRAQATFLDAHFHLEHQGRFALGACFNFNGTAGVWRRSAIVDAGGWDARTLTEDLDLSYRAQLAGKRFVYLDDVAVPSELPDGWCAFRAQQGRWVRGSVETARHLLGPVLRSNWSLQKKAEAILHLGGNAAYVWMAMIAVLLPVCVLVRDTLGWAVPGGRLLLSVLDLTMLTAGSFAMVLFYVASARRSHRNTLRELPSIFFALSVGAGLSLSNAREAFRGLSTRGGEFVRTPKRGRESDQRRLYRAPLGLGMAILELAFAVYFGLTTVLAAERQLYGSIPFLLLYGVGFAAVGGGSMREILGRLSMPVGVQELEPKH